MWSLLVVLSNLEIEQAVDKVGKNLGLKYWAAEHVCKRDRSINMLSHLAQKPLVQLDISRHTLCSPNPFCSSRCSTPASKSQWRQSCHTTLGLVWISTVQIVHS